MCYTPPVSLFTALTEFALAIWIRVRYRRATLAPFGSVLMIFLGLYQLSEFLLCTTPFERAAVMMGFVSYSYLPAVALHAVVHYLRLKVPVWILYVVPVIATVAALVPGVMLGTGMCNEVFVTAQNFQPTALGHFAFLVYSLYYAAFIILSVMLSLRARDRARDPHRRKLFTYIPLAIAAMTIPTFVLIIMFPYFGVMFPSVLCHFALLFAAFILAGVRHEEHLITRTGSVTKQKLNKR